MFFEEEAAGGDVLLAGAQEAGLCGEFDEEEGGDEAGEDGDGAFYDDWRGRQLGRWEDAAAEGGGDSQIQRQPEAYMPSPTEIKDNA